MSVSMCVCVRACLHVCLYVSVCNVQYRAAATITSAGQRRLDASRGVTFPRSSSSLSEQLLCHR